MNAGSVARNCTCVACASNTIRARRSTAASPRPRRCVTRRRPISVIFSSRAPAPTLRPTRPPSAKPRPLWQSSSARADGEEALLQRSSRWLRSALTDALCQAREQTLKGRVLPRLEVLVRPALIDEFASPVIDLEFAGTQNLQRLLQRVFRLDYLGHSGLGAQLLAAGSGSTRSRGARTGVATALFERNSRRIGPFGVEEWNLLVSRRRCGVRKTRSAGGAIFSHGALALVLAYRHDGDGGELRAHIARNLLCSARVAEESEPQAVPRASLAGAFHRIERVGAENCERRDLLDCEGRGGRLQLHSKGDRGILPNRLLQRAARAGIVRTQQRNAVLRF